MKKRISFIPKELPGNILFTHNREFILLGLFIVSSSLYITHPGESSADESLNISNNDGSNKYPVASESTILLSITVGSALVFLVDYFCKCARKYSSIESIDSPKKNQPKRPRSNSESYDHKNLYRDEAEKNELIRVGTFFKPNFFPEYVSNTNIMLQMKTPLGIVTDMTFFTDLYSNPPKLTRKNLHHIQTASRRFAKDNHIYKGKKLTHLLEVTNVPGLVYAKYKSITEKEAIILSNWIIALFAVDDRFDLARNKNISESSAVKALAKIKTNVLYKIAETPTKELNEVYREILNQNSSSTEEEITIPVEVRALANAFRAFLDHIKHFENTRTLTQQWINSFEDYINAVVNEKALEERQDPQEFYGDKADQIRNEACGGLHAFKLGALLKGVDIDNFEKQSGIKDLAKQVCAHVQWFNDLTSYHKEKKEFEKSHPNKIFSKHLVFNKVALLARDLVKKHPETIITAENIRASDQVWLDMEQRAFQQLHHEVNQLHTTLNIRLLDLIADLKTCASSTLINWQLIYLNDLHGWLNGQVPWATFSDRYALSGKIDQDKANDYLVQVMQPNVPLRGGISLV
ncbi:MAG: terpene synthase family protein [Candidatus Marinamargulisbacteria bacterium]